MENAAQTSPRIEAAAGIAGGKPRVAGSRIRVQDIAIGCETFGMSIVSEHPGLTLSDIHAALSHDYERHEDIQKDIREGAALAEAMRRRIPSKIPLNRISGGGNAR